MSKPKFDPLVTRIKLNPEQAVLACGCYDASRQSTVVPVTSNAVTRNYCAPRANPREYGCRRTSSGSATVS